MNQVPTVTAQIGDQLQLLVQFIDPDGNIIDLNGGSDFIIKLKYPDGSTQDFTASLYTDGSDGIIVYTTSSSDLYLVGYYLIQGQATLAGKTFATRNNQINNAFYVYENIDNAVIVPPINTGSALIFFDGNNVRWAMTVSTGGVISNPSVATPAGPINSITLNQVVLQDPDGVYWTITMQTDGTYLATPGGTYQEALTEIILTDSNGKGWVVTISNTGVLGAA